MTNSKDGQPRTVAELMDPQDERNDVDLSGLAVDWQPEEILAAAEMSVPSGITDVKPGGKNDTK